jgi:hypothetical protein
MILTCYAPIIWGGNTAYQVTGFSFVRSIPKHY